MFTLIVIFVILAIKLGWGWAFLYLGAFIIDFLIILGARIFTKMMGG